MSVISIFRRIKDKEFIYKITIELLYTFLSLLDYFYVDLKELELLAKVSTEQSRTKIDKSLKILLIKELIALLGNLVVNDVDSPIFVEKNLHLILIDEVISFRSYPKLVKICIGTMTNLTNNSEIRENLSKVAVFIKMVYIVLEDYKDNAAIINYLLKLLLNVVRNGK